MQPNIGLSEKDIQKTNKTLSILLANEMLLYVKTRKFHWNISGNSFMELHLLFQEQYKELEEIIDEIAERINKLGSKTIGTMSEFLELSTLKESPGKYPSQKDLITKLLEDHEQIIIEIRKHVQHEDKESIDAGTTDFITGLMQQHETIAWKLRRYLD
jgi:starvation-inducible DNA-binding protein